MTLLIPHKPFFLVAPRDFVDGGVVLQCFRNPYTGNAFLDQYESLSRGCGGQGSWAGGNVGFGAGRVTEPHV